MNIVSSHERLVEAQRKLEELKKHGHQLDKKAVNELQAVIEKLHELIDHRLNSVIVE